ncbi:c-type cytochrome [Desertivirga xinjiangensis]|uniref:c-type cytochrome n=1 Tax=Desertivirga xinjiangensis TaxID=539206 RepID=UPI00210906DA|nr:c-type cytochrome [Pedobacter xinjiangensis]
MNKLKIVVLLTATSVGAMAQTKKPAPKLKANTVSASALRSSLERGKEMYATYCVTCHQTDGGGVPNLNAPLIKSSNVVGDKKKLINILLKGMQGIDIDGESYSNVMPSASYLTDQQIADVLTYIRNNFENKASAVTAAEVNLIRKSK